MLNNKFQDGIKWHDVACYIRSKSVATNCNKQDDIQLLNINRSAIVCEDSDQLMNLIEREKGVDVRNWTLPAENPVDLNIFNSDLNSDLNSVDLESVESTTKESTDLSGWFTKSVEMADLSKTTAKLESTNEAFDWSDWFGASKTTVTTRKPTTTTTSSGWYIKSTTSAETTTTSGWYIKSGAKTTTVAAKIPEATTTEASYWSNWYYGK